MFDNFDDYFIENPFAGKNKEGEWVSGSTSAHYLNEMFGAYGTIDEMKNHAETEGQIKLLQHLYDEGIILN